MKPKIIYVPWGLGINLNINGKKWIEVNRDLEKYPKLHKKVLEHELKHFYGKESDFCLDMNTLIKWDSKLIQFVLSHPKSWWVVMPFYPTTKRFRLASPNFQIWIGGFLLFIIGSIIILFY